MQKARGERSVYLELVFELPSEKPINCWSADKAIRYSLIITCHHFHYENRLIETEPSN